MLRSGLAMGSPGLQQVCHVHKRTVGSSRVTIKRKPGSESQKVTLSRDRQEPCVGMSQTQLPGALRSHHSTHHCTVHGAFWAEPPTLLCRTPSPGLQSSCLWRHHSPRPHCAVGTLTDRVRQCCPWEQVPAPMGRTGLEQVLLPGASGHLCCPWLFIGSWNPYWKRPQRPSLL